MQPKSKTLSKKKAFLGFVFTVVGFLAAFVAILPLPAAAVVIVQKTFTDVWNSIPTKAPADVPLPQYSVMLDDAGNEFARFYSENRIPVEPDAIPQLVKNAFVAMEDQNFYTHKGWDPISTLRAGITTVTGGGMQGGSGITQQYVKNLLIFNAETPEEAAAADDQNVERKVRELKSAIELEKVKSKDEIISGYLNTVYFGNQTYGIGAASKFYFNTEPGSLTPTQSATLAAMVNNANLYDPIVDPEKVKERRNVVLTKMGEQNYLTPEEVETAKAEPLTLQITYTANGCVASEYPFYCSWVREILETSPEFGDTEEKRAQFLYRGGLIIKTAMNRDMMNKAQTIMNEALQSTQNETAVLATVQPGTGFVPAISSSKKFGQGEGETEIILATVSQFQQGSTFKPLTAAAAIEAGFSPLTRFTIGSSYAPLNRNSPPGGFRNSEDGPGGDYDMASALHRSSNTWLVALEDKVGVVDTAKTASKMGIDSLPLVGDNAITESDASLTLGTFSTSPLQVANSFATLAAGGVRCNPLAIVSVTTKEGKDIPPPPADCRQVIKKSTADIVTNMLTGVIDGADPYRTGVRASLGRPAAGKTGTSDSFSSAWFAGYTPQYATAVMITDPRGGFQYPLNNLYAYYTYWGPAYGGGAPALIWKNYMTKVHEGIPPTPFPPPTGESWVGTVYATPNVVGLPVEEAKKILLAEGYTPNVSTEPGPALPNTPSGVVSKTDPPPGTRSTVKIENVTVNLYLTP